MLRRDNFGSPIVAMDEAKLRRASFDPSFQPSR
jgi:hypothetical protein